MEHNVEIISKNIAKFRKSSSMTQYELAEKLNYSDKAVSKWERGEGLPDISVLMQIADIFGVTLNDLCYAEKTQSVVTVPQTKKAKHFYISILSCGIVWLVATIIFTLLLIFAPEFPKKWLAFVYAIPVSAIIEIVFNSMWGKQVYNCIFISTLIWGTLFAICFSFNSSIANWLFLIGIPLQILTIIWYMFKSKIIEKISQKIQTKRQAKQKQKQDQITK